MEILGLILMGIGGIIMFVGGIWFIVVTFQQSVLWGLGSLFLFPVTLVFLIKFWDKSKKPFLIYLAGGVLFGIGIALGGKLGTPS